MTPNIDLMLEVRNTIEDTERMSALASPGFDSDNLWYQGNWRCESGMCFAGWAAELSGVQYVTQSPVGDAAPYVFIPDELLEEMKKDGDVLNVRAILSDMDLTLESAAARYNAAQCNCCAPYTFTTIPDEYVDLIPPIAHVAQVARRLLGLESDVSNRLFSGENKLPQIDEIIENVKNGH